MAKLSNAVFIARRMPLSQDCKWLKIIIINWNFVRLRPEGKRAESYSSSLVSTLMKKVTDFTHGFFAAYCLIIAAN